MKETALTGTEIGANYVWGGDTSNNTIAYYWSSTCHNHATYGTDTYSSSDTSGCSGHNDYAGSKIKEVVDNYMTTNNMTNDLKEVAGYKIRLITQDDLIDNLGFITDETPSSINYKKGSATPSFVYQNIGTFAFGVTYWTMTPDANNSLEVRRVRGNGDLDSYEVVSSSSVRPVINLLKSAIPSGS